MRADEIRMLAEEDGSGETSNADLSIAEALLDYADMVERCKEVLHDIGRDISSMNGYPLNMDAKDFVEKLNYIMRGAARKEEK